MNLRNLRMPIVKPGVTARLSFLVLAVSATLVLGVVLPGQISWAQGVFPNKPNPEWTYPTADKEANFWPEGIAAVGPDGTVYVAGRLEEQFHNYYYLFAFYPTNGKVKWQKQLTFRDETTQFPVWVSSPAVGPNGVIYITADGRLYAFNPDNSVKWQYEVAAQVRLSGAAVAFDGTIYICTQDQLVALTPDGKKKWAFTDPNNVPGYYMSDPVIGPTGTIYVTRKDMLYAVKPTDGLKKWNYARGNVVGMPVIGGDGTIYLTSYVKNPPTDLYTYIGELDALSDDGSACSVNWRYENLLGAPANPVIGSNGDIYMGTYVVRNTSSGTASSGAFYAITPEGTLKWGPSPLSLPHAASTAAVGYYDRIFFQCGTELYAMRSDGYILDTWELLQGGTVPIIDLNGHIYFGANGRFWAVQDYTPGPAYSPWPLVRQGLRATGTAEELAKKWEFTYNGLPPNRNFYPTSPAVAPDGTVYINTFECVGSGTECLSSTHGTLYALKPNGQKKWGFKPENGVAFFWQPVLAPDGTAYVVALAGTFGDPPDAGIYLFAIGPNGTKKWAFPAPSGSTGYRAMLQPVLGPDGTVYWFVNHLEPVPGEGQNLKSVGTLYAINPTTGTEKWKLLPLDPAPNVAPPVVGIDGTIYVLTSSEDVDQLDVISPKGTMKWQVPINLSEFAVPTGLIMGIDRLYVSSTEGDVYAFSLGDESTAPKLQKQRTLSGQITQSPALGPDGTLYVPVKGKLYALNETDLETKWECDFFKTPLDEYFVGSPTVGADGTIYIQGLLWTGSNLPPYEGELWAVNSNPYVGTVKRSFQGGAGHTSPAIAPDGTVYTRNNDGTLYALKSFSHGLAASVWPIEGHDLQRSGRLMQTALSGSQILIEITDPDPEAQPTTILFETILWPGFVDLTIPAEIIDPPPPGYLTVDPPFLRELQTTADYVGPLEVCFDISQLHYFKRENLRVFHWEIDAWVDRTSPPPAGEVNRLCATVESLSQFAIFQPGKFTGFFPPVGNLPTMNQALAGQFVPVKFSLDGDQGLNIFSADYPKSQKIDCTSKAPIGALEPTVTAGKSGLSYDATRDQYIYVWQTQKAWAGTCRQLIVRLNDGSDHRANFKFK